MNEHTVHQAPTTAPFPDAARQPGKKMWCKPTVTILQVDATRSGPAGAIEEGAINKPGS